MPRVMLAITIVALWIYGIIDCARTPKESMPGRLPKPVWIVVALIPIVGALLWLLLSWPIKHPNGFGTIEVGRGRTRTPEPKGPIAPDDDPEFLAKLDARNRFAEWERQQAKAEGGSASTANDKGSENDKVPSDGAPAGADTPAKSDDSIGGADSNIPKDPSKRGGASNSRNASDAQDASKAAPPAGEDPLASHLDDLDAELRKLLDDEGSGSA